MENNINEIFNQKDKRISFLSILHSCAILHQGEKLDAVDLEAIAYGMTNKLFKTYPAPNEEIVRDIKLRPIKSMNEPKGKICPVPDCGQPMIRQFNKKNPKAPDWKCSDKNCKFKKAYDGGWMKSEFITSVWDDKPQEIARANHEDSILEESNQIPEEYR